MQALVDPGEVAVKTQRRKIVDPEWGEHQDLDGDGTLDAELSLLAALLLGKTPQEIRQAEKTPGRGRVVELLQGGPVLDAEARSMRACAWAESDTSACTAMADVPPA